MPPTTARPRVLSPRLREVLIGYLQGPTVHWVAGGDSLTLDDVLGLYDRISRAGQIPGRGELLRTHPDLTDDLVAYFGPAG